MTLEWDKDCIVRELSIAFCWMMVSHQMKWLVDDFLVMFERQILMTLGALHNPLNNALCVRSDLDGSEKLQD